MVLVPECRSGTEEERHMRAYVATLSFVVGVGMMGLWAFLVLGRRTPEINEGKKRSIWFHLVAELTTACLLLGAGVGLIISTARWSGVLAGLAFGALLYTTINSSGYYADLGQRPVVLMFGVLTALTAVGAIGVFVSLA
jgi:hypothetical protein